MQIPGPCAYGHQTRRRVCEPWRGHANSPILIRTPKVERAQLQVLRAAEGQECRGDRVLWRTRCVEMCVGGG